MLINAGDNPITIKASGATITIDGGVITISGERIITDGETRLNNGTRAVVYVNSTDSRGDINNQGESSVKV